MTPVFIGLGIVAVGLILGYLLGGKRSRSRYSGSGSSDVFWISDSSSHDSGGGCDGGGDCGGGD